MPAPETLVQIGEGEVLWITGKIGEGNEPRVACAPGLKVCVTIPGQVSDRGGEGKMIGHDGG